MRAHQRQDVRGENAYPIAILAHVGTARPLALPSSSQPRPRRSLQLAGPFAAMPITPNDTPIEYREPLKLDGRRVSRWATLDWALPMLAPILFAVAVVVSRWWGG